MSGLPVSAIIPTLNAAACLPATLAALRGAVAEIIIADGGSSDGTAALAQAAGARVIKAPRGRGPQLRAAAEAATQPWLLSIHADTRPGAGWQEAVANFIAQPKNATKAAHFRFELDDAAPEARRLEAMVAWRCRWLGLPYGDQGLLIARDFYEALGGYEPIPLMEDVALIRRIGRRNLVALPAAFITSAEKWRRDGWYARSARNLFCLSLWFAGVSPERIARIYARRR
ncbi:MAG: TIGR04283 family arsenosugar biosynthesis glycosyltransferase [Roseomonas sp.]|nr:TIGR04283 family arsenosugar biosynthesis glycosyltransferase [Roseomonas sp.]MCA3367909.1 TIGR04283 family arsenosugar biosynthesis glycosyltransferase [Roseomonas sp.]